MGRPKSKTSKRDHTGKSRGEPVDVIKSVAWAYRAKEVPAHHVNDPMAGYTLGRLRLAGKDHANSPMGITEDQFDAGEQFASLIRRHANVLGYQIDPLPSPGFEMVSYGVPCGDEHKEDYVIQVRRQFSDAYRALVDTGIKTATLTYDVCLDRIPYRSLDGLAVRMLRVGLDALIRLRK